REQLQAQLQPALLAGQTALGKARRLPRGGRKALVATASRPAARDPHALTGTQQLPAAREEIVRALALRTARTPARRAGVRDRHTTAVDRADALHLRPRRDAQHQRLAVGP